MKERDVACARKYAKAFLNVWPEVINLQLLGQLTDFAYTLQKERRRFFFLYMPHRKNAVKVERIAQFCDQLGLPWQFQRLVSLLLADKLLFLLPEVIKNMCELYMRQHNILSVKIKSSVSLDKAECDLLTQFLARKTGASVQYRDYVDRSLIAGIRIESGRVLWEHSARKQLRSIMHAGYHIEGAHE